MKIFNRSVLYGFFLAALLCSACGMEKSLTTDSNNIDKPEEVIIATAGLSNFEQLVLRFNQKNGDNIKVRIENYASNTTVEQAIVRLNMELASGKGPDIIDFETIPVREIYSKKGLLENLSPLVLRDLDPEDYFVIDFLCKSDLFYVPASFNIMTCYGLPQTFDGRQGLTFSVLEALYALPQYKDSYSQNRQDFLQLAYVSMIPDCIDWKSFTCNFKSEKFAKLLSFTEHIPDTLILKENIETLIGNGSLPYAEAWISNPIDLYRIEQNVGGKIKIVGYPTVDGKNGTYLYLNSLAGINRFSKHTEEAWRFLKYMISDEEYQNSLIWGTIPVRKECTNEHIKYLLNPYATYEGKNIQVYEDGTYSVDGVVMDQIYNPEPIISEEVAKQYQDLIQSSHRIYEYDPTIFSIISKESEKYFDGGISLNQALDSIQSKVTTYLSEQQ